MNDTDVREQRSVAIGLAGLFGAIVLLALVDLVSDWQEGGVHVLVESGLVLAGLVGMAWMGMRARAVLARARAATDALREHASDLAGKLADSRAEAAKWKLEASQLIGGLAAAIDLQLERWGLSPAEKEVALLLLKGLAHKEIAEVRRTNETTVRQQARAVYKKAGLEGRHDLAAFFLEDLLAPRTAPLP